MSWPPWRASVTSERACVVRRRPARLTWAIRSCRLGARCAQSAREPGGPVGDVPESPNAERPRRRAAAAGVGRLELRPVWGVRGDGAESLWVVPAHLCPGGSSRRASGS